MPPTWVSPVRFLLGRALPGGVSWQVRGFQDTEGGGVKVKVHPPSLAAGERLNPTRFVADAGEV